MKELKDDMYELLPSIYRIRDNEEGKPLHALINILANETKGLKDNISQLYENWFIETCEEWLVPYIGDLLGVRGLHTIDGSTALSQRAYVANTLRYRRRKGIAPVLEQLTMDTAGWRSHATEFLELLIATQYMNHVRLHRHVTPDMRRMNELDLVDGAFDTLAHSADVRHISSSRGRHNISNVGLFIWRLQSYPVRLTEPMRVDYPLSPPSSPPASPVCPGHYFTFSPLGNDFHLFNRPQTEESIHHLSEEKNVPCLLRRRALLDELEARRQAPTDEKVYAFFDDREAIVGDPSTAKHPVFEIFKDGTPIKPENITIRNLTSCCVPTIQSPNIEVVVDPELGRFMFTGSPPKSVRVSYSYGFSGDVGSGPYDRRNSIIGFHDLLKDDNKKISWQIGVSKTTPAVNGEVVTSIKDALAEWHSQVAGTAGIIVLMDSESYVEDLEIKILNKSQLLIIAADWPVREDPHTFIRARHIGDLAAGGLRPHIRGAIRILSEANASAKTAGTLSLDGLLIQGRLTIEAGNLGQLRVEHCTLVPKEGGLAVNPGSPIQLDSNQWLKIILSRSITGPIALNDAAIGSFEAVDCLLDGFGQQAINGRNTPFILSQVTVLGRTNVKTLEAENSIFNDTLRVERTQTGCLRFSFAPPKDLRAPRRFHCQPEMEAAIQIAAKEKLNLLSLSEKTRIRTAITEWLRPQFTSVDYDHHGYGQLSRNCPTQISKGAEDEAEMGVFRFLRQPQRAANLRIALDEYLPLGLEAGLIYVS